MKIHSTFLSIDGEVNKWGQGTPSYFIRLQGCNLRCPYCDAPAAQDLNGGIDVSVEDLVKTIEFVGCPKITITGGEPLLQEEELRELLNRLFSYHKYKISIETNGTISTRWLRQRLRVSEDVCLVVDYKIGNCNKEAFVFLREWDWVKIVVGGREDFDLARKVFPILREWGCKARFAVSPIHGVLPGQVLTNWVLGASMFEVSVNLQLHKFIEVL
jgi:7-carboxy-7-deazaguanine synthase